MTAGTKAPEGARHRRRRLLGRAARAVSPAQLLGAKYQLTPGERGEMYARGTALGQVAVLIGSSFYFLVLQRAYGFHDPGGPWNTVWWWKDMYDRFPVHVQNGLPSILAVLAGLAAATVVAVILSGPVLRIGRRPVAYTILVTVTAVTIGTATGLLAARGLAGWHAHWFPGQSAPPWWVAARHQFRHFLIGAFGVFLISTVTIGLGRRVRGRVPNWAIPLRFLAAFAVALPVAAVGIGFFAWFLPHVLGWDAARLGLVVTNSDAQIVFAVTISIAAAALITVFCLVRRAGFVVLLAAVIVSTAAVYALLALVLPRYGFSAAPAGRGIGTLAGQWIGKGAWEATLTGVLAGLAMKPVLRPAQYTLQLISIEKKMTDRQVIGDDGTVGYPAPLWWWRWVYGPNYVNTYEYCVDQAHQPQKHGVILGLLLALTAPVFLIMIANGIWLLYLGGPATGVH